MSSAQIHFSQELLASIVETTTDYVIVWNSRGQAIYANASARQLFGIDPEADISGLTIGAYQPEWARKRLFGEGITEAFEHGCWEEVSAFLDSSGKEIAVSQLLLAYRSEDQEYLYSISRKLNQNIKTEHALGLLEKIFNTMQEGLMITDSHNIIKVINPAFTKVTGYSAEEVIGKTPQILKSGRHTEEFYKQMWKALSSTGHWTGEIWNRRKNGEIYPEWISISSIRDESDTITHYVATFSDISTLKISESKLQHLANHDALTGLPNRILFYDRFKMAAASAEREQTFLAVLFLDLDRFKPVNDTYGHYTGDLLLQAVAERLQGCVREEDTISRVGGDEFLVLLTGLKKYRDAARGAEKIINILRQPFMIEQKSLHIGLSIGISIYPLDGVDVRELIRKADTAMYIAKTRGGNCYNFSLTDDGSS